VVGDPRPSGSLWASLLLGLVSVAFTLGAAEFVLRSFLPIGQLSYRLDDELLFEPRPDSARLFVHRPGESPRIVVSRVNSQGFRGPELRVPRPAQRVVVFGDSFIHGEYAALEDTFAWQLERQLSPAGEALEVVNAGVRSYGPDQALLRMQRTFDLLGPDLVVFAVYSGNDYGDPIRNKLFRIRPDGGLERRHPTVSPELREEFEQRPLETLGLAGLLRAAKRAAKLRLRALRGGDAAPSLDEVLEQCEREFQAFERSELVGSEAFEDHYDLDLALEPGSPSAAYKARMMRALLAEAARFATARAVPLVVVVIPAAEDVAPGAGYLSLAGARHDPERLARGVVEAADAAGLPVIDLSPAFRANEPAQLYLPGDFHWNPRGQALAARVVAERIRGGGGLLARSF
jgi:lysophospholipase L1-like esterase